ncbi:hydroxymethylglutaryl-CoA lyase [Ravibacter arvi]|uniref:Hydroxymethylglutaryl-CoA lyase n=1 Tax=Ravibacter arvi TaxID=2051041 RepID=A0ABP8MD85_9BACT
MSTPIHRLHLVECPRDAWQGMHAFIPTGLKARYVQKLIETGFDTIDVGSFVSPRAVPQVSDTAKLLAAVSLEKSHSRLLAIVANLKGSELACEQEKISDVGYPFSLSETFQLKNTNASIGQSFRTVADIYALCQKKGKELVVYLSMGFGNPYGDPWTADTVFNWVEKLSALGIKNFSLADTVGLAKPDEISLVFEGIARIFPDLRVGAHFHSRPDAWLEKVSAAFDAGCRRFDGTISGFGGCPFAQDDLVGNIATENLVYFARKHKLAPNLNSAALEEAREIFRTQIAANK